MLLKEHSWEKKKEGYLDLDICICTNLLPTCMCMLMMTSSSSLVELTCLTILGSRWLSHRPRVLGELRMALGI